MSWKPKEKPLTAEQAIELAKSELSRFWFGSTPLLAAVQTGNHATVHPLDKSFSESPWLVFFLDPMNYSGGSSLIYAREWERRYGLNNLRTLVVLRPAYSQLKATLTENLFYRKTLDPYVIAIDTDGMLCKAFQVREFPKVILIKENQQFLKREGKGWREGTELEIQKFLRSVDPGLPLSPVFRGSEDLIFDTEKIEFGLESSYPAPGFRADEGGAKVALFSKARPSQPPANGFFIKGKWTLEGDRISTQDLHAEISFTSPASHIAIVAQSLSKISEASKIVVELNEVPVYEAAAGEDLIMSDEGQSLLPVKEGRIYHMMRKLPAKKKREVTLLFTSADRVPVALYGIRFGE